MYDLTDEDDLLLEISRAIQNEYWCKKDYWSQTSDETLSYAWTKFCSFVKHRSRYFFLKAPNSQYDEEQHDEMNPLDILQVLDTQLEKVTVNPKTDIYRARFDSEQAHLKSKNALRMQNTNALTSIPSMSNRSSITSDNSL